jgi:hypothetical protein
MSDFNLCYSFLLPNEAAFKNGAPVFEPNPDPTRSDPAAQALAGINSAYWPEDFAAILALPQDQRGPAIQDFYKRNFWGVWLDKLDSNKIAAMVLDASVNQGEGWAVRFLQTACGATVDGIWGPNTIAAANSVPENVLIPAFVAARKARYTAVGGPSLPEWLARASKVPQFA